jgi:hypothetical protein
VSTIHLIDGEKGGTGKSWVARTMHHILQKRGIAFVGVDADMSNPTYYNVYSRTVEQIPFSLDRKSEDMADEIFQQAIEADVIVSLPAQVHKPLLHWMLSKDVPKIGQEKGITIKKWWISDGEDDSIHLFLSSLAQCDPLVQHIFVQNQGRCDEWEYFDTHARIQQAIRDHKIPVIQFPQLGQLRRIRMNAERMTFEAALVSPEFGILGQAQVSRYLQTAEAALEHGGAFGEPTAEAMSLAQTPMPKALLARLAEEKAKEAEAQAAKAEAEAAKSGDTEGDGTGEVSIVAEIGNDAVTASLDGAPAEGQAPIVTEGDGQPELVTAGGDEGRSSKKGGKNGRTS